VVDLHHEHDPPQHHPVYDRERGHAGGPADSRDKGLLDIIRTFTLFSTSDKGEMIKVVGRYQQFRSVKLAVKRLLEGKTSKDRSGIIWHTQGSGTRARQDDRWWFPETRSA